jgi:Rieske Fe-S protein
VGVSQDVAPEESEQDTGRMAEASDAGETGAAAACPVDVPEGSTCEIESYKRLHPPPMPRRDFLVWAAGLSLGATAVLIGATVAQAIAPPSRSIEGKTKVGKLAVARVDSLVVGKPVLVEYGDDALFVSKLAADKILVLSAACPHVRCKLFWNDKTRQYDCPCHASSFSATGKKLGGPAPRDMYAATFAVENGQVVVSGVEG